MLRFPDGMRDRLKRLAAENNRSLNAEIISRLEETLKMDDYQPVENIHPDDDALRMARELVRRLEEKRPVNSAPSAKRDIDSDEK